MTTYSERMNRLEDIVRAIQSGVDVDELLRLFEEGQALHAECSKQLDDAEARINLASVERPAHPREATDAACARPPSVP
jgi:exodeoxyribonuclease VII small subunit